MFRKITFLLFITSIITACSSANPNMHYRNDYNNQVYGRVSFGYNLK